MRALLQGGNQFDETVFESLRVSLRELLDGPGPLPVQPGGLMGAYFRQRRQIQSRGSSTAVDPSLSSWALTFWIWRTISWYAGVRRS